MGLQDELNMHDVSLEQLDNEDLRNAGVQLNVLRLDKIHPVVSGNKWFKLKYYLQEALTRGHTSIATFGGAFSNHILATAYACNKQNIECTGYIRGEEPRHYSQTLLDAQALNMRLDFLSREDYSNRQNIMHANPSAFFIPDGGYGKTGIKGAAEILQLVPGLSIYDHIVCACGTGTMLAGVANASLPQQQCIGISVMKNNISLETEVRALLNDDTIRRVKLLHDYHFGGYAKYTQSLIDFMNKIWLVNRVPLDFVYTAKALYAACHLAKNEYFSSGSNILFIHSGGLQGNRSLPNKALLHI